MIRRLPIVGQPCWFGDEHEYSAVQTRERCYETGIVFGPSFPFPAREHSFTVILSASKIFGRKTAQLSEALRESVYSGSA
jgi:hypothetical protein